MGNSTCISPPLVLESSALFKPRASKMKPTDPPSYYARLLASATTVGLPEWTDLEKAVNEFGKSHFGSEFATLIENGQFRLPFRRDVHGKGWPSDTVVFLSLKSGADYPPNVLGRDSLPIMDQSAIYPGCIVRVSMRLYYYGGKGSSISPGISFGLNNVQKLGDGPRLATARGDGSEFGSLPPDDLDSLL